MLADGDLPAAAIVLRLTDRQLESNRRFAQEIGRRNRGLTCTTPIRSKRSLGWSAESRITQLIVGHAGQSRWLELLQGSLVKRLLRRLPDINVHIVAQPKSHSAPQAETPPHIS